MVDRVARQATSFLFSQARPRVFPFGWSHHPVGQQQQQWRGIMVRVSNGNVEQALQILNRRMRESGMEALIRKKAYFDRWMCDHHVKDSTRRYVHRRKIQYRIRNQELFKTLKTLLAKKMRETGA